MMSQHEVSESEVSAIISTDIAEDPANDGYDSISIEEGNQDSGSTDNNREMPENGYETSNSEHSENNYEPPPDSPVFMILFPAGATREDDGHGEGEERGLQDWMQMMHAIQGMQKSLQRSRKTEKRRETFDFDKSSPPPRDVMDSPDQTPFHMDPFLNPDTSMYGLPQDGRLSGETVKHPGICALEVPDRVSSTESITEALPSLNRAWEGISDPGEVAEDSSHAPRGHPARLQILSIDLVARSLHNRFHETGDLLSLDAAINHRRRALLLPPLEDPEQFRLLIAFTLCLQSRYNRQGDIGDLHESIYYLQQSLQHKGVENDQRSNALKSLSGALDLRFHILEDLSDLDEGIIRSRELLDIQPPGHEGRCDALCRYIVMVTLRFRQKGLGEDLEEGVYYAREHLELHLPGHRMRPMCLTSLAELLQLQFLQNGNRENIEDAIRVQREALLLLPAGHRGRAWSLNSLASFLMTRYSWQGDRDNLEEAIVHLRQSLLLRDEGGAPKQHMSLEQLGHALLERFRCCGDRNDLDDAIQAHRNAIEAPNPYLCGSLQLLPKLAKTLLVRFQEYGQFEDVDEAIILYRKAIRSRVLPHNIRSDALSGLASALCTRYRCLKDPEDVDEAVSHLEESLRNMPVGNLNRTMNLNNLANTLIDRMGSRKDTDPRDVDQAIKYFREVLLVRPPGHPGRAATLNSLGGALVMQARKRGKVGFVDESLDCHQEALDLTPLGHPNHPDALHHVASSLFSRFFERKDMSDLANAVSYFEDAVRLSPPKHPQNAGQMESLAFAYLLYGRLNHDESKVAEASIWYERSVDHETSSIGARFQASLVWVASRKLDIDNKTLVRAYRKSLELADRYILIKSSVVARHKLAVSEIPLSLASDAASSAIDAAQLETAVEFLEQGRTHIWSQIGRYRTSVDSLKRIDQGLGEELVGVSRDLESAAVAFSRQDLSSSSMETEGRMYRQLANKWDTTIEKIRELSGFENFLRATPFKTLKEAAVYGPVIMVNISEHRSDAIIIQKESEPLAVPLPSARLSDVDRLSSEFSEALLPTTTERNRKAKITMVLHGLWDEIVGPIVERLQEIGYKHGSRIWWCPTYKLSSLPLHAAGPYRGKKPSLLDIYVSSYTSTLTALIKSSQVTPSVSTPPVPKLLLVAQPDVPGQCQIQSVVEEIRGIQQTVPVVDLLLDEDGSLDAVLTGLRTCRWIHFACHGTQDLQEPFQSRFHLSDKPLRLLDIIQAQLPNAEFAYSAACHSAAGDKNRPDEVIHLVAGLQFSGFKSVIGTLYAMADIDGPVVAEEVYKYLFRRVGSDSGSVDFRDAARALNIAAKKLREMKVPVERWINFIHIGA